MPKKNVHASDDFAQPKSLSELLGRIIGIDHLIEGESRLSDIRPEESQVQRWKREKLRLRDLLLEDSPMLNLGPRISDETLASLSKETLGLLLNKLRQDEISLGRKVGPVAFKLRDLQAFIARVERAVNPPPAVKEAA